MQPCDRQARRESYTMYVAAAAIEESTRIRGWIENFVCEWVEIYILINLQELDTSVLLDCLVTVVSNFKGLSFGRLSMTRSK